MKPFIFQLSSSVALMGVMCGISTATSASFDANYDNLPASAALTGSGPGTYEDLIYNSWITASRAGLAGGYAAQSSPNVILTNSVVQASNGTPTFTVAPPYKSASFKSFYFGCDLATEESEADVTTQCTITVTGFQKGSDEETAIASYTFSPPIDPIGQVPMVQAVLPSGFNNVYQVTVIQNSPVTQSLGVDNLVYTVST